MAVCTVKVLESTYVYSSFVTVPLLIWLYVVISLAPRVVQSYLFNLSGFAVHVVSIFLALLCELSVIFTSPQQNCVRAIKKRHGATTNQAAPLKPPLKGSRKEKPGGGRTKPRERNNRRSIAAREIKVTEELIVSAKVGESKRIVYEDCCC